MRVEDTYFSGNKYMNCRGKLLTLDSPRIMSIVNINEDSFYSDSRINNDKQLISRVLDHVEQGADMVDIGVVSSRPGSKIVDENVEGETLERAVSLVKREFPELLISVDTFRTNPAKRALEAGAEIVNDIAGWRINEELLNAVKNSGAVYITMHAQGDFSSMHQPFEYKHIGIEVVDYFIDRLKILHKFGLKDVVIDPGFGFSKNLEQNYQLLQSLGAFKFLDAPILVGISRKSMIYKLLEVGPEEALNGTTALNMFALMNGANILRVHDTKEASELVKLWRMLG